MHDRSGHSALTGEDRETDGCNCPRIFAITPRIQRGANLLFRKARLKVKRGAGTDQNPNSGHHDQRLFHRRPQQSDKTGKVNSEQTRHTAPGCTALAIRQPTPLSHG